MLTWNVVALQPPPLKDLYKLLQLNADFIAIGLQEVKSQPQDIIIDALYEDSWTNSWRWLSVSKNVANFHVNIVLLLIIVHDINKLFFLIMTNIFQLLINEHFGEQFRQALSEHDYIKVHTIRLVGIILSLFTKRKHLLSIRDIETSYTRIGLKGLWVSAVTAPMIVALPGLMPWLLCRATKVPFHCASTTKAAPSAWPTATWLRTTTI